MTLYRIGRSRKNTIKITEIDSGFNMRYISNGGLYESFHQNIESCMNRIADMMGVTIGNHYWQPL